MGDAQDSSKDQVLDEILVGPVPVGTNKFVLQADPPDVSRLDQKEILGVTVVLVTCSYKEREFVRVGYYVNNEYIDPDFQSQGPDGEEISPPLPLDLTKVQRQILADKPRVTKFPIPWTTADEARMKKEAMDAANSMVMGTPSTVSGTDVEMDVE